MNVLLSRLSLVCVFIGVLLFTGQSRAQVIFSDNFNSQSYTNFHWDASGGNAYYYSGQAAESGFSVGIGPTTYVYTILDVPSNTDSVQVTFWLRIGHNSFSSPPRGQSSFHLYWDGVGDAYSSWYIVELHRGASGRGTIQTLTIDIPRERIAEQNYLLFYNQGTRGYYHIDNVVVSGTLGQRLDHFTISNTSSNASVCAPHEVLIEAKDSANQTLTDFEGDVEISTSTGNGDWSMSAANSRFSAIGSDTGRANYRFAASDNGQLRLRLSNEHAETLTINVRDPAGTVSSNSTSVTFSENAFVTEYNDSLNDDIIAYRSHGLRITMMKRDSNGECGAAQHYNRSGVYVRQAPLTGDPGGIAPQLVYGANSTTLSNSFTQLPITFVQGVANVQLSPRDVGRYRLEFEDRSNGFSDSTIAGQSSELSVRPFAFASSAAGRSNSLSANAPVFKEAGERFQVSVTAVGWQPSDDVNNDGIADGHNDTDPLNNADLSNNPIVSSFGAETPGNSVLLSSRSLLPSGLNHQDLSGETRVLSFVNGVATAEVAYSNAGIMEMDLELEQNRYLGGSVAAANRLLGRSSPIGRFIPDHFVVQNTNLDPFCTASSLTHLNQPFDVSADITAVGVDGRTLDAYHGDFAKLSDSLGQRDYDAKPVSGSLLSGRVEALSETLLFNRGQARLHASLRIMKTSLPETPLREVQLGLKLSDSDGVEISGSSLNLDLAGSGHSEYSVLGSSDFYFSRLFSESRHGPESNNLPLPFEIQSWAGHSFARNEADSCSIIERRNVRFNSTGSLDVDANLRPPIAASSTLASFNDLQSNHIRFEQGSAGLVFSAPGLGQRGEVEMIVDYSSLPWLSYDWNQNNTDDDVSLPNAVARFGTVRGHDLLVYWREKSR
ncbi:DUF6701 domain-containing protein [Pseudoteredinibacter isoporae]|uniref:DUF6701 domain-containing protein n=1 Tax=Pseudoteredinibacter isoporae TaxID=570281 RepID=UPI0031094862